MDPILWVNVIISSGTNIVTANEWTDNVKI